MKGNIEEKWTRIFAQKRFGGKDCVLTTQDQLELIDDITRLENNEPASSVHSRSDFEDNRNAHKPLD